MTELRQRHYKLGQLPWSRDSLKKAFWQNFIEAYELIKEHPGFAAYEMMEDIQRSLEIFFDHAEDLLSAIAEFKDESFQGGFFLRGNGPRKDQLERRIRKALFGATTSALALVEPGRQAARVYDIPEYQSRVDAAFANNEQHRFIQGFRNAINHEHFLSPSWQVTYRPGEEKTQILLKKEVVARWDGWDALAMAFISKHSDGIDIEKLILDYRNNVEDFHRWLRESMRSRAGPLIDEYLCYKKILDAEGARPKWRILLNEAINRGIDPYQRLDEYLTPTELEKIQALPKGSKEQVDLIISIADEYGACDDEIRALAYKLFNVK